MTLPILISVPHAGLQVPPEAEPYCCLSESEIVADGDEGAAEIYDLADHVERFVTTDIARAIVDLNRAEDDRRPDGVVKTHTCWNVPVFAEPLPEHVATELLETYYRPYHQRLDDPSIDDIKLCVDCHTMAAVGPPIGPDTGRERPAVCLGDANGTSLPEGWIDVLELSFHREFPNLDVTVNKPFSGGYITRRHSRKRPWLQIELSRAACLPNEAKRKRVLRALERSCSELSF